MTDTNKFRRASRIIGKVACMTKSTVADVDPETRARNERGHREITKIIHQFKNTMAEEQSIIDQLAARRTTLNEQFTARRKIKTEQAAELAARAGAATKNDDAAKSGQTTTNTVQAVYDKSAARARAGSG